MRRRARQLVVYLLVALTLAGGGRAFAQAPLDELLAKAQQLTAAGQHVEAYALLSGQEDTYIGDMRFDYALGRAALDAGRPDRATLAFSRVLAVDPGHAGARIDSGRAYLALGNREQARVAFETLLALDPPPPVRAQLLIYLAEARADTAKPFAARGYLAAFAGSSSNVNQSPERGQVFVPGLLAVLQLSDQNIAKSDTFTGLAGGVEVAKPLDPRYTLIASAEFLSRQNTHESDFDVGGIFASAGFARSGAQHLLRVQAQSVVTTLGGQTSRRVQALSVDVTEKAATPGIPGVMFGFANIGRSRHPQADLEIYDADFWTAGAGALLRVGDKSTLTVLGLATGDEDRGGNPSGDRSGMGVRLNGETVVSPKVRLSAAFGALNSAYSGFDPSFLVYRKDRRMDLELTVRYEVSSDLELRLDGWRGVQDSNIEIYEYRRTDWTLGLRYRFD